MRHIGISKLFIGVCVNRHVLFIAGKSQRVLSRMSFCLLPYDKMKAVQVEPGWKVDGLTGQQRTYKLILLAFHFWSHHSHLGIVCVCV